MLSLGNFNLIKEVTKNMQKLINFLRGEIIFFNQEDKKRKGKGFYHKGIEYIRHSDLPLSESAFFRLSLYQQFLFIIITFLLAFSLYASWKTTLIALISFLTLLYFADLLFNLFLIIRSFTKSPEIDIPKEEIDNLDDSQLPTYSILCPLYKEAKILPQFVQAMSDLSYPKDKLQIMLLLENDDKETIFEAENLNLPPNFDIIVIPDALPKTKPKALNYGLNRAWGERIVVYDAEDIPEKDQLKKAVIAFQKADTKVMCIQAKLNFYNPNQNILTRVFTAEYSLWFDLVLTGLQSIHAPIPLGGTSNHFRKKDLIELKGWDAFNVTEDCDLGMRLVRNGFKTAIVNSTTYEEANSSLPNWFWQRTRWIKGYMQTYFVHMRKPHHVIPFHLVVGGKVTSMLINPVMWILTILYFVLRAKIGTQVEFFFPIPVFYMAVFSLVFGNFLYLYYYMMGCAKRKQWELIPYAFLVPFYWLFMSLAAYTSVFKLITNTHYWAKTKHGLHLNNLYFNRLGISI